MNADGDPNKLIAMLAAGGIIMVLLWRLIGWVREAPATPDPWDAETEQKLSEPETKLVCHHCSTPQGTDAWFCPHCGSAVGTYNNLMPYVSLFSTGEVLRNGVTDRVCRNPSTIIGYIFYSLVNYFFFAPIYWFFLFKNLERLKKEKSCELQTGVK